MLARNWVGARSRRAMYLNTGVQQHTGQSQGDEDGQLDASLPLARDVYNMLFLTTQKLVLYVFTEKSIHTTPTHIVNTKVPACLLGFRFEMVEPNLMVFSRDELNF